MNRRDILRGLGALPFAAALNGYVQDRPAPARGVGPKIQSVQVLLEGAFTLVLEDKPKRVIAFIPQDKSGRLGHKVYFNDPARALAKGNYKFTLSQEGLQSYEQTYINPDFRDIEAHTDVWNRGPELITLELPYPDSINFSGRPLNVLFQSKGPGKMPTSYILEYYTKEHEHARLNCSKLGKECRPSPNCPPGTTRYFFGAKPDLPKAEGKERKEQKEQYEHKEPCHDEVEHAIHFFNDVILAQFPKLEKELALKQILDKSPLCSETREKRGAANVEPGAEARFQSAVFDPAANAARLLRVADLTDCQVLGPIIHRP